MTHRASALRATATAAAVAATALALAAGPAGASSRSPHVSLSSNMIVPGQVVTVTGAGWPVGTAVDVSICGAAGVDGSAGCASQGAAAAVATARGLVWTQVTGAVPPVPCPCVATVTAGSVGFHETIPVTVEGAASAPVHRIHPARTPAVRIASLTVASPTTFASAMGGAARRLVEIRLANTGDIPVTPVLVGSWGRGPAPTTPIRLPVQAPLPPGHYRTVRASFDLSPLAVGSYTVRVQAQLVGYPRSATAATSTGQWPVGLFALAAVVLLALLLMVAAAFRARRRRRAGQEGPPHGPPPAPGAPPDALDALDAAAAAAPRDLSAGDPTGVPASPVPSP